MPSPHALARLAALAAIALAPAPVVAQTVPNDARCFMVSNLFASSKDAKAKAAAAQVRYFYLGRLTGSAAQIEAALLSQAKQVTPQNAGSVMQACARAVAQKATEVQAIGQRLSKAQRK